MKTLLTLFAAAGLLSAVSAARPAVMVQETAFSFTPRQFRALEDCPDDLINVKMTVEYPIAIDGVSEATLNKLRALVPVGATLRAEGPDGMPCTPAQLSNLLMRINEKLRAKADDGLSMGALDYVQKITFPYANSRYAVMEHIGYDNEGGNGFHGFGFAHIYRLSDMKTLGFKDLVKDRKGLGDLLVAALNRTYFTEDENGKRTPYLSSAKNADWSTDAVYKGTPEITLKPTGIAFTFSAYEIMPGCCGMPSATLTWAQLKGLCDARLLADLEALTR